MKAKIFILAALGALLGGCAGSGDPDPVVTASTIVTYVSTDEAGISTFTFTDNDGRLITLTGAWTAPSDCKPGQRLLILYTAPEFGISSSVTLYGATKCAGGGEILPGIPEERGEGLDQASAAISGDYLNFGARVSFGGDAKAVDLYCADSLAAEPELTVVVLARGNGPVDAAPRNLYASWALGSLAEAKSLKIIYQDSRNEQQTITLKN